MQRILLELQAELERDLHSPEGTKESLGAPVRRLKSMVDSMLDEMESNPRYDPFEFTNRLLRELDRLHRLKM